jgi:hypothetical protein
MIERFFGDWSAKYSSKLAYFFIFIGHLPDVEESAPAGGRACFRVLPADYLTVSDCSAQQAAHWHRELYRFGDLLGVAAVFGYSNSPRSS